LSTSTRGLLAFQGLELAFRLCDIDMLHIMYGNHSALRAQLIAHDERVMDEHVCDTELYSTWRILAVMAVFVCCSLQLQPVVPEARDSALLQHSRQVTSTISNVEINLNCPLSTSYIDDIDPLPLLPRLPLSTSTLLVPHTRIVYPS
jgi:hypothetical protein